MSLVNIPLCQLCDVTFDNGAKYLAFFSSHSLKTREKYNSFAQFVYFLREVCLQFLNDKIHYYVKKKHNCEFYHSKIEK